VGPRLGCGCFAGDRVRDYRYLLGRNLVLMAAAVVAWLEAVDAPPSVSFDVPREGDLLPALLAVLGIVLASWVAVRTVHSLTRNTAR
jgi:hypothetical protein